MKGTKEKSLLAVGVVLCRLCVQMAAVDLMCSIVGCFAKISQGILFLFSVLAIDLKGQLQIGQNRNYNVQCRTKWQNMILRWT